jgi:hypothetical protein
MGADHALRDQASARLERGRLRPLTRIFAEEVLALQRRRGRDSGFAQNEGGLLVFQHRFGGSLNLNTHLHAVVVDGVFERGPPVKVLRMREEQC